MKRALIGIATMIVSTGALAVVTDKFKCELEVTDLETKNRVIANDEFFVSRLPVAITPDGTGTIQVTEANADSAVRLDSRKATYGVDLKIKYFHAVKFDAMGQTMDARQKSCITIFANYCKKTPKKKTKLLA